MSSRVYISYKSGSQRVYIFQGKMFLQTLRLTQKRVSRAASVSDTHLIAGAKKAALVSKIINFSRR